jgi:ribonuclease HII
MLSEFQREALFDRIAAWCSTWAVGHASPAECDRLGMSAAQRLAAQRALAALAIEPDRILLDGKWDFVGLPKVRTIVRGDATSLTIAAASILAKVTRDRLMRAAAPSYPAYEFDRNKGYPGPRHRAALAASGPTPIHRRSWSFMDGLVWTGVHRTTVGGQQQLFAEAVA